MFGIDGPCQHFSPPAGYWCGLHTAGGGGKQYTGVPTGITVDKGILPHWPYASPEGMVVQMLRPNEWASWMFNVSHANQSALFFDKGGFQGARGCGNTPHSPGATKGCGSEFYVENVLEELE